MSFVCDCIQRWWVTEELQSVKLLFLPGQNSMHTGKSFSAAAEGIAIKSTWCCVVVGLLGLCASTDTWVTEPNSFQPGWTEVRRQHWCDCSPRLIPQLLLSLVAPSFAVGGGVHFFRYTSRLKGFLYFTPCPSLSPIRCICSVSFSRC